MRIALKNNDLEVCFKELGGELASIKDLDGIEYLWQGDAQYWSGQAPVLFPICGSVRNDMTFYRPQGVGKIPRHGLVRKKNFELIEQTEDRVTFVIEDTEETYQQYPYHFRLEISYRLIGKKVSVTYRVHHLGEEGVMPFFVGGHPGFNCPLLSDEGFEDYYLEFQQEETCSIPKSYPETGLLNVFDRTPFLQQEKILNLDYDLFQKDAITLDCLQSRSVTLRSRKHEKGISVHFPDFSNLIIWTTPNKGPFIAIEPWSGLSTSLEESDYLEYKKQVRLLPAGQTAELGFEIEIL